MPPQALSYDLTGVIIVDSGVRREGKNRAISALVIRGNSDFVVTPQIGLRHAMCRPLGLSNDPKPGPIREGVIHFPIALQSGEEM